MKFLLSLFCVLSFSQTSLAAHAADIAREVASIKVEYYDTTNKGVVRVKGCSQCSKKMYSFTSIPLITRNNKTITFKEFMADYWNATFATLLLDKNTLTVQSIHYQTGGAK